MFNANRLFIISLLTCSVLLSACNPEEESTDFNTPAIRAAFGSQIDLNNLPNYANQEVPSYITKDNTRSNYLSDEGAILGRVLFYDLNLSVNNEVSCSSCHLQAFAFGDTARQSVGAQGLTPRHSMRIVNPRHTESPTFFWDRRAETLEDQATTPIHTHEEMGFSGENGDPSIDSLIRKLSALDYYRPLFQLAFGDETINEERMRFALAQFMRSLQSYDSKFDEGMALTNGDLTVDFPNYTEAENRGKDLFLRSPGGPGQPKGAGCQGCHQAPEFDIAPNSGNNGIIGMIESSESDLTITRSPSLRDLQNAAGRANGPYMHTGQFATLMEVVNHYNKIPASSVNVDLDSRLLHNGQPQQLNLSAQEKAQLVAFLKTLGGHDIYSNPKWSDPFVR